MILEASQQQYLFKLLLLQTYWYLNQVTSSDWHVRMLLGSEANVHYIWRLHLKTQRRWKMDIIIKTRCSVCLSPSDGSKARTLLRQGDWTKVRWLPATMCLVGCVPGVWDSNWQQCLILGFILRNATLYNASVILNSFPPCMTNSKLGYIGLQLFRKNEII